MRDTTDRLVLEIDPGPITHQAAMWCELLNDCVKVPCEFPCLRDDLQDWMTKKLQDWMTKKLREADLRARLDLEQRDEPRERGYSNFDSETAIRKTGPVD